MNENLITRTEIINVLFSKYNFKSYLEIGVRVPEENFNKINANIKESVDPNPMGKCNYIITSDDFFEKYVNKKYDVIFVDGLHTEEQVYKDVYNAIKYLNEDGFIVIHDCNPPTEYHIRTYDEYLKTRGQWNGTVFKAFIRLKNELVDWSCFVVNEDFGCGIITKRKILKNIIFNNDANKLNWKYFEKNRNDLLQLITFNEYLNILK